MRHIESMKSTKARRNDADQKAFADRKGKRNKHQRGKDNWSGLGASEGYAEKVQGNAVRLCPNGVPAWHKES